MGSGFARTYQWLCRTGQHLSSCSFQQRYTCTNVNPWRFVRSSFIFTMLHKRARVAFCAHSYYTMNCYTIRCNLTSVLYDATQALVPLTGSSTVTAPSNLTMWGCLNWAMMAASWRNVALCLSVVPSFSLLMATPCGPYGVSQVPLNTSPNSPEPRTVSALNAYKDFVHMNWWWLHTPWRY